MHGIEKEDEFIQDGVLSIGWPCLGDLTGKSKEEITPLFHSNWPDAGPLGLTQLWNFVSLPVGSIILVPSFNKVDLHIFETTSGYFYNKEQDIINNSAGNPGKKGNPHQIKAKRLKTISRELLPGQVKSSLWAARRAVTVFTKYSTEIENIIENSEYYINNSEPDHYEKAMNILIDLLDSEKEEVRLQAAIGLLQQKGKDR